MSKAHILIHYHPTDNLTDNPKAYEKRYYPECCCRLSIEDGAAIVLAPDAGGHTYVRVAVGPGFWRAALQRASAPEDPEENTLVAECSEGCHTHQRKLGR